MSTQEPTALTEPTLHAWAAAAEAICHRATALRRHGRQRTPQLREGYEREAAELEAVAAWIRATAPAPFP